MTVQEVLTLLGPVAKKAGLKGLEVAIDELYLGGKVIFKSYAESTPNKVDDFIASQLDGADAFVAAQIDKISP